MTQKKQAQITVLLVVFNVVFWPLVFFPQLRRFVETFQRDVTVAEQVVARQRTPSAMMQRIDYEQLRNIFEYGVPRSDARDTLPRPVVRERPAFQPQEVSMPSEPQQGGATLQLRSVLNLQGKMIATLQDRAIAERMFTAVKGDTINGYVVVEIESDSVVLERGAQRLRLSLE